MVILIAFFGTIFAVNFTMARFAIGTFGGTVVDNSYVASQQYNGWLDEARAQAKLGWQVTATRGADAHVFVTVTDADGPPLENAKVSAIVRHPLGRSEPIDRHSRVRRTEAIARSLDCRPDAGPCI